MINPVAKKADGVRQPIVTSILALLSELTRKTNDDNVVVAALTGIFSAYEVRHSATLAPVRIVGGRSPQLR